MNTFSFQSLNVYIESKKLVKLIYKILETFPNAEKYALCDQLRRAVISVPSNIAEGLGRGSTKEQIHFFEISYGSLMEVLCQIEIAMELGYITSEDYREIENNIVVVAKLLSGLRNSAKTKINNN